MTTAFPPNQRHSSRRISTAQAQSLVAAYLEASSSDPSLHPNALLTEGGPTTTSSAANPGLVLHNLKRVEAGLRGEHLGSDIAFGKTIGDADTLDGVEAVANAGAITGEDTANGQAVQLEEGWQDRSEFEREQDDVQGEIGIRDPAGSNKAVMTAVTADDKKARNLAKKERLKQERKRREEQKRKEREAEKR